MRKLDRYDIVFGLGATGLILLWVLFVVWLYMTIDMLL